MKNSSNIFRTAKTLLFVFSALSIMCLTSCKKDSVTDDRDAFVGTYSTTASGNAHITIGDEYADIPLTGDGSINIAKSGNGNMVKISGDIETNGVVSGNTISLDACTYTQTSEGITLTITENFNSSTLDGSTLVIKSTLAGTAYYQGYSFPLTGYVNYIAVK